MARCLVLLLACVLTAGVAAGPRTAQAAPMAWKVQVGADSPDHGIQAQDFFPHTITIDAGDTIAWTMSAEFAHTVSFRSGAQPPGIALPQKDGRLEFNPLIALPQGGRTYGGRGVVSSGFLEGRGKTYTLTFTTPGQYRYDCLIHPGMSGTVIVRPRGTRLTETQADYDRIARGGMAAALQGGRKVLDAGTVQTSVSATTGTVHTISLGGSAEARASVIRFAPEAVTIKAGDTVRWIMKDPFEIHTVTFVGSQQPPEFIVAEPQPQGPPRFYFHPKAARPIGGAVHNGAGYYNSGILFPTVAPGPKVYALTFTKPGTYTYWCVVHVPQGMKGVVIVR
jgi:plastocyanin